jgi:hypothetical protein
MNRFLIFLLTPLLLTASASAGAENNGTSGNYSWKPLKIGGGGWVTGMWIHPTEPDLMYVRTDVSGAYRRDATTQTWKQIVTSSSIPADFTGYAGYEGVNSLCGAPSNPDIAYMAFRNQVFKSVNRGDTWVSTNYYGSGTPTTASNGEGRQEGERLAVDPNNSDVVYYGGIAGGLWVTSNGGDSWQKISAIPNGLAHHGVNTVVFDKNSGTTGARTNKIFVTVDGQGVYRSVDAGANWTKISTVDNPRPRDAEIASDGTYYVVFSDEGGATGGVWKYSTDGIWTEITPEMSVSKTLWEIAVDPTDSRRIAVQRDGGLTWTSVDGGVSWNYSGSFELHGNGISWVGNQSTYWLSTGELLFDPFDPGKLWFAEGFGVWWTKDLADSRITWEEDGKGIEETCGNTVLCPPGGNPLTAQWDIGVFHHSDPDQYNAVRAFRDFMSAWHLDYCAGDPSFIAATFQNHINERENRSGYSTDGGLTWTKFPSIPSDLVFGCIAVSANSKDNLVYLPANNKLPYYTANRGVSWSQCAFPVITDTGLENHASPRKPLCADRVNASTFYFHHLSRGVFRSTDGGASWTQMTSGANQPFPARANSMMKSTPGHAGDLWIAEGKSAVVSGGLWHSVDGGATWTQMWTANSGLQQVFSFGFGKAQAAGGYPCIFAAGISGGQYGIYRSADAGNTWTQIGVYPLGIYDYVDDIDGDKEVFGKVYVCFAGAGFAYGEASEPGMSVSKAEASSLSVTYQNGNLNINNVRQSISVRIYSPVGIPVYEAECDHDFSIDLSGMPQGMLIVNINNGNMQISRKIMHV